MKMRNLKLRESRGLTQVVQVFGNVAPCLEVPLTLPWLFLSLFRGSRVLNADSFQPPYAGGTEPLDYCLQVLYH